MSKILITRQRPKLPDTMIAMLRAFDFQNFLLKPGARYFVDLDEVVILRGCKSISLTGLQEFDNLTR